MNFFSAHKRFLKNVDWMIALHSNADRIYNYDEFKSVTRSVVHLFDCISIVPMLQLLNFSSSGEFAEAFCDI